MPAPTRTFRIFVSSTFGDFAAERDALHELVYPRLQELCAAHGARFQAVDLRWGISEAASREQRTLTTCLSEVRRCQRTTPRPNFIALVGDRYGWRPLPTDIPATDFTLLEGSLGDDADRALLTAWYRRDDNAVPAAYFLQPRYGDYEDEERWAPIENRIAILLRRAATDLDMPPERRLRYVASATEQETTIGALGARRYGSAFCFMRAIDGLPEDRTAGYFRDLDESGDPDRKAELMLEDFKARLRSHLGDQVFECRAAWAGAAPTTENVEPLCAEVYRRLSGVIED